MSTLPELFRSTRSTYLNPKKQGGIFTIKIKQQAKYDTLNKKYSESRAGTSCTTRTGRSNRNSVSYNQRPYSRQSVNQENLSYGSSKYCFAIYETKPNVEEADSLKNTLDECIQKIKIQNKLFKELQSQRNLYAQELKQMQLKIEGECQYITDTVEECLKNLRKRLSDSRRESGMEIKVNGSEVKQISQNLTTIGAVMEQIQENVQLMYLSCLK